MEVHFQDSKIRIQGSSPPKARLQADKIHRLLGSMGITKWNQNKTDWKKNLLF